MNTKLISKLLLGLYQYAAAQSLLASAGKTFKRQGELVAAYADGLGAGDESEHAEGCRALGAILDTVQGAILLHANGGDTIMQGLDMLISMTKTIPAREGAEPIDMDKVDFDARADVTRRLLNEIRDAQGEEVHTSLIMRFDEPDPKLGEAPEGMVAERVMVIGGDPLPYLYTVIRQLMAAQGIDPPEGDYTIEIEDGEPDASIH